MKGGQEGRKGGIRGGKERKLMQIRWGKIEMRNKRGKTEKNMENRMRRRI